MTGGALASPRPAVRGLARAHGRLAVLLGLGAAAVLVGLVLGVAVGTVAIAPSDTFAIVVQRIFGLSVGVQPTEALQTIVWEIRLPRVLTSIVVGAGLAVAGTMFQGLLRNPLADPYVLGTASGAALGAAIAVLLPVRVLVLGFGLLHVFSFAGALLAVWAVYRLSRIGGLSPMTSLLLTGYAVGSLLAAGLAMAMYLSGAQLRQIFAFLLGAFDGASWTRLAGAAPLVLVGCVLILLRARVLNGLLLGSLVTAAAVTVSGLIGFVGLVVPHVIRLVVGPNARLVLPLSAVWGAALMVYADIAARVLGEIPVGVVTAVIGAPFFLYLLRRSRTGYEL